MLPLQVAHSPSRLPRNIPVPSLLKVSNELPIPAPCHAQKPAPTVPPFISFSPVNHTNNTHLTPTPLSIPWIFENYPTSSTSFGSSKHATYQNGVSQYEGNKKEVCNRNKTQSNQNTIKGTGLPTTQIHQKYRQGQNTQLKIQKPTNPSTKSLHSTTRHIQPSTETTQSTTNTTNKHINLKHKTMRRKKR